MLGNARGQNPEKGEDLALREGVLWGWIKICFWARGLKGGVRAEKLCLDPQGAGFDKLEAGLRVARGARFSKGEF